MVNSSCQEAALSKEIESLNVPKDSEFLTKEQVMELASLMKDDAPLEEKRRILQSLIYYIEIDEEEVIIHWKF